MDDETLIPARHLNEWVYCPRLFHLEHVQRIFVESAETVTGSGEHRRGTSRSKAADVTNAAPWGDLRSVTFDAPSEGITGKFDVLTEVDGTLVPVEAKHGAPPSGRSAFDVLGFSLSAAAWPTDQIQLAAQAVLVRAAGEQCVEGRIWYRKTRELVKVAITDDLLAALRAVASAARQTARGPMPPPLIDSAKCLGCSLVGVCLPDETNLLLARSNDEPRKIVPGRHDGGGLWVLTTGTVVGKSSSSLAIRVPGESEVEVPIKDCEHLAIFGYSQITAPALSALLACGRTVSWHSTTGRLLGRAVGAGSPNLALRRMQYRLADDPVRCLPIARSVIVSKIRNQRTLLRRNHPDTPERGAALAAMAVAANAAAKASDPDELRGIEGGAARLWFAALGRVLTDDEGTLLTGRSRRPPADPGNAALSFGYAVLVAECIAALSRVGLDPDLGFFHVPVAGRPALALDLMEPFRPLIVDSVVLRAFGERRIRRTDFIAVGPGFRMNDSSRRALLLTFEERMDELVTHPTFSYRMSYRRILDAEARLLARYIEGELPSWKPLETR